jgi:hypothetical protein
MEFSLVLGIMWNTNMKKDEISYQPRCLSEKLLKIIHITMWEERGEGAPLLSPILRNVMHVRACTFRLTTSPKFVQFRQAGYTFLTDKLVYLFCV